MIDLKNCSPMQLTPEALREDPCVQAAAFAMQQTGAWLLEQIDRTSVYASIDLLPENILDLLAEEFRAQYYDALMPIEQKRIVVKNALRWYEKAGTLAAVKELCEIVWGENVISEGFEHDGRPYTFWLEVMSLDAWITDKGMADFMAALQKVKNTRSLLDRIIFHRHLDTLLKSGAVQDSYKREVIVDFYTDHETDTMQRHTGVHQENYLRRSVVDFYRKAVKNTEEGHLGAVPVVLCRQSITQEG